VGLIWYIAQIACDISLEIFMCASTSKRVPREKTAPPRVALIIETSNAYGRGLLAGVAEYVRVNGPWSVYLPETRRADDSVAQRLKGWRGDGVLVRAEDRTTAQAVAAFAPAVVDLSAAGLLKNVPAVHSDVRAEAEMAFDHLWERGFRHLGFCGVSDYAWAAWQRERFCERAAAAGADVDSFIRPLRQTQARRWASDRAALKEWLKTLPKPVGIFACYDLLGQQVLDVCRAANLRIPDDAAVVGVDDDAVRCGLSDPPLSSVAPNTRLIGLRAAELLASLMAGEAVKPGMRLVAPLGVAARRSTEALAVDDPDVAAALRYIRDHCCEPITIEDVLGELAVSRRSLETRFEKHLGRTPHAEIVRCRIERAGQLLAGTDLPIKVIAARVGVATPEYLSAMFRRALGTTPSGYRALHQPNRKTLAAAY
jgi:LacI family transcriptional regulator